MSRMPAVFVSHGAPTLAIEPGPTQRFLRELGARLPRPSSILCVSAHWEADRPSVTGAEPPRTIHDFGGFPDELYRIRYPAPGAPDLARRVGDLVGPGERVAVDRERGLDHGAWVPLLLMYPAADVPVAQLSVQTGLGPRHHLALGAALRPLRDEGVLILASGGATHDLRGFFRHRPDDPPEEYAVAFDDWLHDAITAGRTGDLVRYRDLAPEAARNHPTEEHYLPLLVAAGAAAPGEPGVALHRAFTHAALSLAAYGWGLA
jgi:4,5-DOPA dioxygenase extradiol